MSLFGTTKTSIKTYCLEYLWLSSPWLNSECRVSDSLLKKFFHNSHFNNHNLDHLISAPTTFHPLCKFHLPCTLQFVTHPAIFSTSLTLQFYRPANLWIPECGTSNFGMRDTKMACIAKHSKQNDKMRDIPDFRTFLLSEWGTVPQNAGHLAGLNFINLLHPAVISTSHTLQFFQPPAPHNFFQPPAPSIFSTSRTPQFFQPTAPHIFFNFPHPAFFSTSYTPQFFNLPHAIFQPPAPHIFSTPCTLQFCQPPVPRILVTPHPIN